MVECVGFVEWRIPVDFSPPLEFHPSISFSSRYLQSVRYLHSPQSPIPESSAKASNGLFSLSGPQKRTQYLVGPPAHGIRFCLPRTFRSGCHPILLGSPCYRCSTIDLLTRASTNMLPICSRGRIQHTLHCAVRRGLQCKDMSFLWVLHRCCSSGLHDLEEPLGSFTHTPLKRNNSPGASDGFGSRSRGRLSLPQRGRRTLAAGRRQNLRRQKRFTQNQLNNVLIKEKQGERREKGTNLAARKHA